VGIVKNLASKALGLLGGTIPLTEQQRQVIWRLAGGWMPLNFNNNFVQQIQHGYSENVDVYAIIKKIVDISKSIPWVVERQLSNGTWKEMPDSTLHELMDAPNVTKGYTWNDIEEQTLLYLLVTGNTYIVGNTQFNSSLIEELDILPTQAVNILNKNSDFFMPLLEYQFSFGSSSGIYTGDQICHVKFYNPNLERYYYGLSPIQVAGNVVQVGNERWTADASILGNKGISGMITDRSQLPMTAEESDIVDGALKQKIGGAHKFGQILTTNKDLNYIQIGMSSADMELLKKGVVTTRTLCNVLGLDSSLFNDPENKTYNNRLEAEKAMYTNCIMPLSDKMSVGFIKIAFGASWLANAIWFIATTSTSASFGLSTANAKSPAENAVATVLTPFNAGAVPSPEYAVFSTSNINILINSLRISDSIKSISCNISVDTLM